MGDAGGGGAPGFCAGSLGSNESWTPKSTTSWEDQTAEQTTIRELEGQVQATASMECGSGTSARFKAGLLLKAQQVPNPQLMVQSVSPRRHVKVHGLVWAEGEAKKRSKVFEANEPKRAAAVPL